MSRKFSIIYLALTLMGCASSPEEKQLPSKLDSPFVRIITTKTDLLYNYKLRGDGATGFELAEADAEKICRSKWGLRAVQKTQASCGSYDNSATICAVAFMCQ